MAWAGKLHGKGRTARHAGAAGLAVLAELFRSGAHALLGGSTLLFAYFPFILGAALGFGMGPGLLCTALCALAFRFAPTATQLATGQSDGLLLFCVSAALACFMVEHWRTRAHGGEQQRQLQAEEQMRVEAGAIARDREARLEAILGTAVEGIITIDERGIVDSMNPAAERMFGYRSPEVVGWNVRMLMPPPYEQEHDRYLEDYLRTARKKIIGIGREVEGRRKDGSRFPLHLSVSEVRDGPRLFTGFLRDLTEQKRLEAEYLHAQKMEAVGRLAAGVAHDFNNLLAGILGGVRIAAESLEPDHPAAAMLREIGAEATRGAAITRHLLDFSRTRAPDPRPLDPCAAVRATESMIRRLLGEDIEVELDLRAEGARVLADAGMLEQALVNLAINARDAMPSGGRLVIACRDAEPPPQLFGPSAAPGGPYVAVSVEDNGSGMDGETLRKATEPFFTTKEPGTGTGLGLSTVHSTAKAWGGGLDLESALGVGTRATLYLPRVSAGARPTSPPEHAGLAVSGEGGKVILVVEDERLVRRGIQHMLEKQGHRVLTASGAEEALELLQAKASEVDLLLTDVVLPRMGGPELAVAARAIAPALPTLFMSAFPQQDLVARGRIAPGVTTVEKPFSEQELAARVRDALSRTPTIAVDPPVAELPG